MPAYLPQLAGLDSGRRMSAAMTAAVPGIHKHKPMIDIQLDGPHNAAIPSFTTLEKIQGIATITCPEDTHFKDINVIFQGSSKTYVEKIATSAPTTPRTQAYHNFLKLTMPYTEADLPEGRIAKSGVTYKFPFTFVVPERLLPQSCTHDKDNCIVQDAHLQLPPSTGDPMLASDGRTLLDDLAPQMTQISYAIRVMLTKPPKSEGSRPCVVADSMKKLRIIPRTEEQPPLRISDTNEDDYIMCKSKELKKGLLQGKHGLLTMSASQPPPLRLPYLKSTSECSTTTMAKVELRFDPLEAKGLPPKLEKLWSRLKVATFYATTPLKDFPSKSNAYLYDSQRGIYVETLPLSSRCVESAAWTKHELPTRRDSAVSVSEKGLLNDSLPYWTAEILCPIELPTHQKSFVPTFHTCLISRVYALDLVLSSHTVGSMSTTQSLHLKLPLQITSDGNPDARPVISPEEAASIARREADFAFVPRSFAPPEDLPSPSIDVRGARGSVFQNPRWGASDSESEDRVVSQTRRGSSPLVQTPPVPEDEEMPPMYTAVAGGPTARTLIAAGF